MKTTLGATRKAIWIALGSAGVAWFFFEAALYSDLLVDQQVVAASESSTDVLFGPEAALVFRPSIYLIFAAVAMFGVGSLVAHKQLAKLRSQTHNELARAGFAFTTVTIIISLGFAAWSAIQTFLMGFFEYSGADINLTLRLFNTYLPIVLFTALVVWLLLSAFVFRQHQPLISKQAALPSGGVERIEQDLHSSQATQKTTGLAFAVPIIAVAGALIFGLIVFDVTQTALPVWIWVIIQAVIGAGIIAGTVFAEKSTQQLRQVKVKPFGAPVGARNLNFVLSIIFAAVVSAMSLGYGAAAMEELRASPDLGLSVYSNDEKQQPGIDQTLSRDNLFVYVSGSDLERNSAVQLNIEGSPSVGEESLLSVFSSEADREGNFWTEEPIPSTLEPGDYTLELRAISTDGRELLLELEFAVVDERTTAWPGGTDTFGPGMSDMTLQAPSFGWVVNDLLPAFLLIILAIMGTYFTLVSRNREQTNVLGNIPG